LQRSGETAGLQVWCNALLRALAAVPHEENQVPPSLAPNVNGQALIAKS
jgi:hypothetical protein